jgi:hypothetical protein
VDTVGTGFARVEDPRTLDLGLEGSTITMTVRGSVSFLLDKQGVDACFNIGIIHASDYFEVVK